MRIAEILFWNNEPAEANRSDPQLDLPHDPSSDLFTKLANAYAKDRLLKRFWNAKGSEAHPSGPAAPDAETELIPSSTLEPTTASWLTEPVEEEPQVGRHPLVPFRQPGDIRRLTWPT
jgi:hypothetical protein